MKSLLIAMAIGLGLTGFAAQAEEAAPIKIGAIFSVTGPAANLGGPEEKTARMLVEQLNAAGGINGHPIELIVKDSGPGIDPAELGRITEPYYRPDAARRSDTGGSGLGLSIARDIALMHGGELQLANRHEGGLAATLRLPRTAPDGVAGSTQA